jgi:hypothetical protein
VTYIFKIASGFSVFKKDKSFDDQNCRRGVEGQKTGNRAWDKNAADR